MRDNARRLVPILAGTLFVLGLSLVDSGTLAQSSGNEQDPLFGTWRLDLSKSKYMPGPPPRSETRTYTRDAAGVKGRIDRHYADGRREVIDYRADADHDSPVSGTQSYDAIRFKRVDRYTTEAVLSHAGRVWGTARRVLSEDGGTLTIMFRRFEPGDMVSNVAVYSKVPPGK
jgi:hypothetical protein